MAKYRRKPSVIEATQWFKNGDHPLDYAKPRDGIEDGRVTTFSGEHCKANDWEGGIVRYFRHPSKSGQALCKHCQQIMHVHGWIDTLEGGHIVCPGDYVATGIKGEHYPIKPHIFVELYDPEPVES